MCLVAAALVAVLVLAPSASAQDMAPGDDDPYAPEQYVVEVGDDELQQIAGQPLPEQLPAEPVPVPDEATLAQTGGPAILLPAAATLLLGSGVALAAYAALRHRGR